ncbi:CvpA family protein [Ferrimonas marina]|uniref:Membrane protein required for colicin V production n=1 Tax=Ferrimonas marina TaxID=299255 RepID=A0A1M5Y9T8_9GAMM|nr:CvpA family protein [Ferrimonas marina]SHI08594.1 membrane protein required for colicin V production [Ferrimonas marina]
MVWIDYAILAIIGLSVIISLIRGFAREAMSLVVWFAAFVIASRFYEDLAVFLTQISDPMLRKGAAIAILFVASLVLGAMVNYLVGQLVERTGLSGTDRVLGACFGALRGVLVVSAILFFLDTFTGAGGTDWWSDSVLVPEFGVVIQWFFEHIEQSSSFLKQL